MCINDQLLSGSSQLERSWSGTWAYLLIEGGNVEGRAGPGIKAVRKTATEILVGKYSVA
jgi:hypothetical protein